MADKRKWSYTLGMIAQQTGAALRNVKRDRHVGKFEPSDFGSVLEYCAGKRAAKRAEVG